MTVRTSVIIISTDPGFLWKLHVKNFTTPIKYIFHN